ncbi:MAG: EAL domain-containing protein [Sedimenticola thiotaurini]|uniref:EAL domain-containing protein n=1 Tax=Sedimenticola thiotaurini TaxID=1543721 RepID=A0A558CWR9_9GAMM|nr:MAG: EAL domain-containing protein [Sedimenticola thiotaurini]
MPNQSRIRQLDAENRELLARLEKAEASLREVLSGEADAMFISGVDGAQLYTLKGADQSYRTLIENMSEGALTLTPEGLILYANQRFAAILGTPLEKVIGSDIYHWFAPESQWVIQVLLQNDAFDKHREELLLTAADGTLVPVYLSASRLVLDEIDSVCMLVTDLTEQKRNEAILAEEKLSNAILEQAADAIVIYDKTGRIIRASKQAQTFYGSNPVGQLFEQAYPLRQLDDAAFSLINSSEAQHRQLVETRLNIGGQECRLLVSIGHLKSAEDELLGSVVTLTDITELKTTELALKKSEQQLSEALTIAKIGYWEYEYSTDEFIFNDQYYFLHRITAEEAGGYRMYSADFASRYVYSEDAPMVAQQVQQAFETRDPDYFTKIEVRILSGEGEVIWVEVRFRIQKDMQGNTIRLFGINQDITERQQAGLALRASEERFKTIFMQSPLGIALIDSLNGQIYELNERFAELAGRSIEEMQNIDWVQITHPDDVQADMANMALMNAGKITGFRMEKRYLQPDGTIVWIDMTITSLKVWGKTYPRHLCMIQDITERKKSEASIKYLNRVLSVLSGINTLIVRVKSHAELFREACNIAVEVGGFRMAMIVIVDPGTKLPVSIISAGKDDELLADVKNVMSTNEGMQKTLVARAMREKKVVISNDTQNDPRLLFGKQYAKAGVNSMTVLPLIISAETVGTFALYANEPEFFYDYEINLLTELASDIAFAIDHIDKQERLNYLAYYDVLTGLANRSLFLDRLTQYMHSAISSGHKLALGMIDVERFKNINDSLGRSAGDSLLIQVAEWLTQFVQDANLLARIDADHFVFVVPEIKTDNNLAMLVEKLLTAFQEHSFELNDAMFRISIKIGIAVFPDDGENIDTLYAYAEAALKKTKQSGNRYLFYTQRMTASVADRLGLENQLRRAIDNEEFVLYYQPKVNLMSGKVSSVEALIRWNDPLTGLVPPGRFIPILEETGLIFEVGRWALRQAVTDWLRWRNAGLQAVRIAVNVSALQLHNLNFIEELKEILSIDSDVADGVELEITESLIMQDIEHSTSCLEAVRALGIKIAIDDFGTGFSSLNYLSKLPVDTLKVDRSFVIEMDTPEGLALVNTIIVMAHALKLNVVAEGVETEHQMRQLLSLNCDEMQGFLFSKPVPVEIFEDSFLVPFIPDSKH